MIARAQDIKINLLAGVGFYHMNTFSELDENILQTLPFDAKLVSNFPPYPYYQPMVKIKCKNSEIGLVYLYQTTGSRISSKDYSGEYRLDTKVNSHSPGLIFNGIFKKYKTLNLGMYLQAGWVFSSLKMNEYLKIDTESTSNDYAFKSNSAYIEPGFFIMVPLHRVSFELNAGYFKEFLRKDYIQSSGEDGKIVVKKEFMETDVWDGARLGLTVCYTIPAKKHVKATE